MATGVKFIEEALAKINSGVTQLNATITTNKLKPLQILFKAKKLIKKELKP